MSKEESRIAYDFRMTQQAISLRIGRALESFDEKYGHLCGCGDLSLLTACYNASVGWTKRFEKVSRLQDSILVPKVPFRFRKVPKRQSSKTITWQPGEREALVQSYIDNGGKITKCPKPQNYWSESYMRLDSAGRKRHEAQVETYLSRWHIDHQRRNGAP
jgi:hypothetical protein